MHLQLPKAAHSSSRALVALVALSGAKVEIADADVKVRAQGVVTLTQQRRSPSSRRTVLT